MAEALNALEVYSSDIPFVGLSLVTVCFFLKLIEWAEEGGAKTASAVFAAVLTVSILTAWQGYAAVERKAPAPAAGEQVTEEAKNVKIGYKKEGSEELLIQFDSPSQNKTVTAWAIVETGKEGPPTIAYKLAGKQIAEARLSVPSLEASLLSQKMEEPKEASDYRGLMKTLFWLVMTADALAVLLTLLIMSLKISERRQEAKYEERRRLQTQEREALRAARPERLEEKKEANLEEEAKAPKKRVIRS